MKVAKKGQFSEKDLNTAIKRVRGGEISKREACRCYNIGRATLDRYLASTEEGANAKKISKTFTNTVFTEEEEKLLKDYIVQSSKMFYGLTVNDLCKLAYQFAEANAKTLPSGWAENHAAGVGWGRAFRGRHSLSLRVAESTSLARASAFNQANVRMFHLVYEKALQTCSLDAMHIWNLDETGVSTVTKIPKLIAKKGDRQVGGISSAERGVLITLCACVNAAGRSLAPVLIYPRKKVQPFWATNAPPGTLTLANESGWMTNELFPLALNHFFKQMGASKDSPQLLIFDNHGSHVTIDVVTRARELGVTIVTLPAHCSHKMQPLDVGVMYPFKTYYANGVRSWHQANPGITLTIHDVSALVKEAFNKAFTIHNIVNGFLKSGIWPPNSDAFNEADFLGAAPTDQPLGVELCPPEEGRTPSKTSELLRSPEKVVSPEIIRPLPKAPARTPNSHKGREKRVPVILTSTPQKEKLIEIQKQKEKPKKRTKKLNDCYSSDDIVSAEGEAIFHDPTEFFLPINLKIGDWMLVRVKGGHRISATYRYVAQSLENYDPDEDWLRVQGYRAMNFARTKFSLRENDIFEVEFDDVVCGLKNPILCKERGVTYEFTGPVDVREA